jgi:succinate dehydrogenase/fumarate reductase cytochrome b subunit (b558 family)
MPSTRVTAPVALEGSSPRGTLAARVFSLSGLLPLGAFLALHVVVNARAIRGPEAFDAAVASVHAVPLFSVLEGLFVYAPLLVHGAVGAWLVATRRPLASPSPYSRPLAVAVRATGVVVLAFLAWHLFEMRALAPGPRLTGGELATVLDADLSSTWISVPWAGLAYLVGSLAAVAHFAIGVWGFLARAGRTRDARARRWVGWAAGLLGFAMAAFLVDAAVLHATGSRLFGARAPDAASREPCPIPSASTR